MAKQKDPMVELLKAIKDATRENTATLKEIKAQEKLKASQDKYAQQSFQTQQKELFQRATAYSQSGMGGIGRGMAGVGGVASGLHGLGATGAASALSARGGALGFGVAAMNTGAAAARVYNDPFSTGSQNARALARMAPGGETVMNWADSFSGRAAGMELSKYHGEMAHAQVQSRLEKSAFSLSHNPQQAHARGLASAFAGGSAVTVGVFNRGTSGGRTAYEDAQRMLPYRQATAKAEREMAASTAQRVSSQKELNRLETIENKLRVELTKVEKELSRGGSGVERQVLHDTHKVITSQLDGYGAQGQQARQALRGASVSESSARAELTKARSRESLLGSADNLDARAQRSEASAGRLGVMDPFQRQLGLQAIKMLEDGVNPDFMPAELKSAAQAFDPDAFDQAVKRAGVNTSEFKERQSAGKRGFEGDYAKMYGQADTLREQAGKEEYRADTQFAQEAAVAGAKMGEAMSAAFDRMAAVFTAKIDNKFREQRNSP